MTENDKKSHIIKAGVAIKTEKFETLRELVDEWPECVKYIDPEYGTLLHLASYKGTPEMIEFLYQAGSDLNKVLSEYTPLCFAVLDNRADNVRKLIQLGAELDSEDSVSNPLLTAISKNNEEIAGLLIDAGIDLTVQYSTRDDDWWDALSFAEYYECDGIRQMILDKMEKEGIDYEAIEPLTDDDFEDEVYLEDYYGEKLGKIAIEYDETDIQKKIYDGKIRLNSEVDLYIDVILPDETRDYITLVTVGMSEEPMAETEDGQKFAELLMKLPADWDIGLEALSDMTKNWPFRMLLKTAHLGHKFEGRYIDETTVIPSGNPNDAILYFDGETELSSVMLCRSEDIPPLTVDDEITIDFFTLIPITEEEAELVRREGSEAVKKKLPKGEVVDMEREYLI